MLLICAVIAMDFTQTFRYNKSTSCSCFRIKFYSVTTNYQISFTFSKSRVIKFLTFSYTNMYHDAFLYIVCSLNYNISKIEHTQLFISTRIKCYLSPHENAPFFIHTHLPTWVLCISLHTRTENMLHKMYSCYKTDYSLVSKTWYTWTNYYYFLCCCINEMRNEWIFYILNVHGGVYTTISSSIYLYMNENKGTGIRNRPNMLTCLF